MYYQGLYLLHLRNIKEVCILVKCQMFGCTTLYTDNIHVGKLRICHQVEKLHTTKISCYYFKIFDILQDRT